MDDVLAHAIDAGPVVLGGCVVNRTPHRGNAVRAAIVVRMSQPD